MPLPVPASVKLKSMFGQCLNWKHQRIWRPKATGLARRLAYGCVGKLRPLAIREAGSGRRFFYLPCTVGGLVVVYPGRATDGDAGEQHMCSATCSLVGPWMDPTRFRKIHRRVWERDVACHSQPITTTAWCCGSGIQAGPWPLPGHLSGITRFFMVALHTSRS